MNACPPPVDSKIFRSWVAQRDVEAITVAGGSGAWFWDVEGKRYLDFSSQRVNLSLGHQHPRMVQALKDQLDRVCTIAQVYDTEVRVEAAARLIEVMPAGLEKIFFTNCGSDAVENAIRMARIATGRHKILTMYRSYHGSSMAGMTLSGDSRRLEIEPGIPGVARFQGPYLYRSPFYATTTEEECQRALAHLHDVIKFEGTDRIAGILIESIVGTNGLLVPPDGYLQGVRQLCDAYGIMLISDEVMCGFGRSGAWFSVNHWDVTPDLLCFAKGVNSGYVPVGGVAISSGIASVFDDRPYPGGGTYYGHPLAAASIVESLKIFKDENLIERSVSLGRDALGPGLQLLKERHSSVGDVRGMGCFWALELNFEPTAPILLAEAGGQPGSPNAVKQVLQICKKSGLCLLGHSNRIHIYPPLITEFQDIDLALQILDDALTFADRLLSRSV